MALNPEPLPVQEPIARPRNWEKYPNPREKDPSEGLISDAWTKSLTTQNDLITNSPSRLTLLQLTSQSASISATALNIGSVPSGVYRVGYYARITTPATTGAATSSLTISFSFTDGAVSPSFAGAAMTGNTTTTVQTGTIELEIDDGSPITYSTTYASDTAGQMKYKLTITVERLAA